MQHSRLVSGVLRGWFGRFVAMGALVTLTCVEGFASVDDSLSFALEAATPYVKEGFQVREDYSGGDLGVGEQKAVRFQLYRGNEYWFWLASDIEKAELTLKLYDAEGKAAEVETVKKGRFVMVRILPRQTGTYHAIVTVVSSEQERTGWALVYGYR